MNVGDIKKQLQALGISISTPGLFGDERFEELKCRLEEATTSTTNKTETKPSMTSTAVKHESLGHLSISELRSRLTSLGIATSTPGLTGEERWNELMKRLMEAICGAEDDQDLSSGGNLDCRVIQSDQTESRFRKPPEEDLPEVAAITPLVAKEFELSFQPVPDIKELEMDIDTKEQEAISLSEINELKKQIKRVSNKRSIYIAAKLSGANQDPALKLLVETLNNIESDINMCKGLQQRGESKVRIDLLKYKASGNSSKTTMLFVDETLAQMEYRKEDIKKEINIRRAEIKEEAECHAEFGIGIEEKLKYQMSQAALQNTKVSRARKRIADSKAIDLAVSTTQTIPLTLSEIQKPPSQFLKNQENHSNSINLSSSFLGKKMDFHNTTSNHSEPNRKDDLRNGYIAYPNEEDNEEGLLFDYSSTNSSKQSLPVYGGIRVEENANSVKHRMGFDRPAPPKGPPPNLKSQNLDDDDDDDDDDDSDESVEDKDENSDEEGDSGSENDEKITKQFQKQDDVKKDKEKQTTWKETSPQSSRRVEEQPKSNMSSCKPAIESSLSFSTSPTDGTPIHHITNGGSSGNVLNDLDRDDEDEIRNDNVEQIKVLRDHAKTLEKLDDILAAEVLHERALELDPTDVITLQGFAVFLHKKKGELARAEAFFSRALQICLPGLYSHMQSPSKKKLETFGDVVLLNSRRVEGGIEVENKSPPVITPHRSQPLPENIMIKEERIKLKWIISLLLTFANFMEKAKGDAEAAAMLLHKAIVLAPDDSFAVATLAHFSSLHRGVCKNLSVTDTDALFRRALKMEPQNPTYMMWYGKFLKKTKKIGPAELMYRSAMEVSKGNTKMEPTTLCNYATFLFKHRKNVEKARELFIVALERFPDHKGLRKNYMQLSKVIEKRMAIAAQSFSDTIHNTPSDEGMQIAGVIRELDTASSKNTFSQQPSGLVTPSLPPRTATAQSSTRGSRRAQRMAQSLVNKIPSDLESSQSKTEFILSQLSMIAQDNEEVDSMIITKKLSMSEDNEEDHKVDQYEDEDFQAIDPTNLNNPGAQFLAAVSPTKSFRQQHPHLRYYDEAEEESDENDSNHD